jgi:hypothetical protein
MLQGWLDGGLSLLTGARRADLRFRKVLLPSRSGEILGGRVEFRHSAPQSVKEVVWRVSRDTPSGERVDSTSALAPTSKTEPSEEPSSSDSWVSSSFDLLHGVDVSENEDTVPAELLDELFQPHDDASTGSGTK